MIGINTAIFSQSGGFVGIGFAIPSKIARKVMDELIAHGHVSRGWIGMTAQDLDSDLSKFFHASSEQGALVSQVLPNSPASEAMLQIGDVILKYNHENVSTASQLKSLVANTKSQKRVTIELSREGIVKRFEISIRQQPTPRPPFANAQAGQVAQRTKDHPFLGIAVQDIPPEFTRLFGIMPHTGALVTGVKAGSPAFDAGLTPGDIILKANMRAIQRAQDFMEFVKDLKAGGKGKSDLAVFYVQRGPDEKIFVPIRPLHHPRVE